MDKHKPARFDNTYCSQCGGEFGPGDSGYSNCRDHNRAGLPNNGDQGEHKARLIAAAPELLAALEDLFGPYGEFDYDLAGIEKARAAIAKVRAA